MMAQYKGATFGELSPYPYAVADAAYRLMINDGVSQSILVSGESGAVKQKALSNSCVILLTWEGELQLNVVDQLSSKSWSLILFWRHLVTRKLSETITQGAAVRTYLLERSRVCQFSDPERNYHCFYMICGAPPEEELNKHDNENETSQSVQKTQSHIPWNDDIYSQLKEPEKRGCVCCMGKIFKPKKSKASLSENQELRDELKKMQKSQEKMRESQERTNVFMANMMTLIEDRLSREDLNVILQAARQATDASSVPDQINSPSLYTEEDGREED